MHEVKAKLENSDNYHDTVLSMLQQFVLVETCINTHKNRRGKRKKFAYDRLSNALYQLNRVHGISQSDLNRLFNWGSSRVGAYLFHGMVWSENKAPDWLENVIKTLGDEMEI